VVFEPRQNHGLPFSAEYLNRQLDRAAEPLGKSLHDNLSSGITPQSLRSRLARAPVFIAEVSTDALAGVSCHPQDLEQSLDVRPVVV
jgi:hypothetical protein